jgi:hypothetical protein
VDRVAGHLLRPSPGISRPSEREAGSLGGERVPHLSEPHDFEQRAVALADEDRVAEAVREQQRSLAARAPDRGWSAH